MDSCGSYNVRVKRLSYLYLNLHRGYKRRFLGAYLTKTYYARLTIYCDSEEHVSYILKRLKESKRFYDKIEKHKKANIIYCRASVNKVYYNLGTYSDDMQSLLKDYRSLVKEYEINDSRNFSETEYMVKVLNGDVYVS